MQELAKSSYWKFISQWGVVPADFARWKTFGLFTHSFLHGGLISLVGNMIVLWAFAGTLEKALGWSRLLCLYIGWGAAGAFLHILTNWSDKIPMVGAGGAVAGMMGAYFVAFGVLGKIPIRILFMPHPMTVNIPAGLFALVWVIAQIRGVEFQKNIGQSGITYFADVGGFMVGMVSMMALRKTVRRIDHNEKGLSQVKAEEWRPALAALADGGGGISLLPELASHHHKICPHCETVLLDLHKIGPTLWRCPSSECQRLVY